MSEYTAINQIIKTFKDLSSIQLEEINNRLQRNDYDTVFINDENNEPLLTLLGNLHDLFIRRKSQIKAIDNLDINKYMGKWYEIARYLTSFQGEDVIAATAEYTLEDDVVKVVNTGFRKDEIPVKVSGTAKLHFPGTKIGKLDVSFFPPFSGNYWIILLANDYRYSVVSGPTGEYLWILSRQKKLAIEDKEYILKFLQEMNFDTSKLFFDQH